MRNVAVEASASGEEPGAATSTQLARFETALFAGFCLLIGLAPLPMGLVVPVPLPPGSGWPLTMDAFGLAIAALLVSSLALPARSVRSADIAVPLALFAAVALFALVQASLWTPESWHNPLWDQASETLGHGVPGAIAVDRPRAFAGLFHLFAYGGVLLLSYFFGRERVRARQALKFLVFSGALYTGYALADYWSGNRYLLWWPRIWYPERLDGTFTNNSHFATYLGLIVLAALGLVFTSFERRHLRGTRRQKIAQTIEGLSANALPIVLVFFIILALFLTRSTGGMISAVIGIAVLGLAFARSAVGNRVWPGTLVALALAIAAGVLFDDPFLGHLLEVVGDADGRLQIYATTTQAIAAHPWLGWGLGAFQPVFLIFRTPDVPSFIVNAAHDDYLEKMLELGLPAALALFAAILWLAGLAARGVAVRQRDAVFPCVAVAATALVAFHSLVDFPLQTSAVTATYLFLLGIGAAQSRSSRRIAVSDDGAPR